MNQGFFQLSPEKRQRIINAGFQVFAQHDYKHASTDEMGRLGGISKGLLFYYFHNKKTFYLFLFDHAFQQLTQYVVDENFAQYTDFFQLCEYAAFKKQEMLKTSPYLFEFLLRAFYSNKEEVSPDLNRRFSDTLAQLYGNYFKNIDTSKFKPGISPQEILQMMTLISDGYVHQLQRTGQQATLPEFMAQYQRWSSVFRQMAYKEEYLDD